jgi:peptidoglycan/LPS O-acetylase OafA/YrhL
VGLGDRARRADPQFVLFSSTSDSRSTCPASGVAMRSAGDRQPARRLGNRPALDGLRGVAVLLVIAVHVGLLASGDIGVDVFFALSGFLITALLYEEWERHGALSVRRFYARRARRLLPALTLLVVTFAALSPVVHTFGATLPRGTLAASTLLFANNWVATLSPAHGRALGPLSPTWSLAQEGQFYLVWPLVLALLLRWRRRPSFVPGVLGAAILGLVAAVPLVRHAYPAYGAYTSPLDRSAELLLGCAAAILWRERHLPAPLKRPITGWLAVAGLALVLAQAGTPQRTWYLAAALLTTALILSLLTGDHAGAASDPPPPRAPRRRRAAGHAQLDPTAVHRQDQLRDLPLPPPDLLPAAQPRPRPLSLPQRGGRPRRQSARSRLLLETPRIPDH